MRHWLTLLFACFLPFVLWSQDPRFSQFYNAPLQVNPAMAGVSQGATRVSINYRNLYSSLLATRAFQTYAFGLERRFKAVKRDYFALSFYAQNDQAGIANYRKINVQFGGSYMKHLGSSRRGGSDQYLVAGAQAGLGQQTIGFDNLWFSAQYNTVSNKIDYNADSKENFSGLSSRIYTELNAGLLWYTVFDENASFYLGAAAHHINQPAISFIVPDGDPLYMRMTLHGGGEIPITDQFSTLPAFQVMKQGPSLSATIGNNVRYSNHYRRELALRAGAWAHFNNRFNQGIGLDAITFTAIFELEGWNLGFSYDVTTSALRSSNYYRGAFETSFIYTRPDKSRKKLACPKL
jgi:type IX secretion system PorP/SprF family membrane protein